VNHSTAVIREPLQKLLARLPVEDHPLVGEAYLWANASHEGQHRDAGQPYITHPIYVAMILASELGFYRDDEMMVAALLHDAVEDSALDLEDIAPSFGEAVAVLVRGVTKVEEAHGRSRATRRAATLQRLFSAAREDPRVLILKLADRIHNMRSIEGIHEGTRIQRIAQETVDVYIPLCHLMGIGKVRRELEDRCLACLEPASYAVLKPPQEDEAPAVLVSFVGALGQALHGQGLRTRIRVHPKHATSLYRKLRRGGKTAKDAASLALYDRYAVEVIATNRDSCYRALGVIHSRFVPTMEGFRDFIALPRRNGYRALHTRVGFENEEIEIYTKTPSMHRMGELGVTTLRGDRLQEQERMRWLHELADWQEAAEDSQGAGGTSTHLLNELKRILFVAEIVVFTPKRDSVILPEGATLLDFAFAVHSDMGLHCIGGTVNGVPETPSTPLNWGDTVEVMTSPEQTPKQHWLRFVKTYRARRTIKRMLR